jgi:hypothetical protein
MVAPLDRRKLIAAKRRLFYLIAVLFVAPNNGIVELGFGTNFLGPFALMGPMMMPVLERAASPRVTTNLQTNGQAYHGIRSGT